MLKYTQVNCICDVLYIFSGSPNQGRLKAKEERRAVSSDLNRFFMCFSSRLFRSLGATYGVVTFSFYIWNIKEKRFSRPCYLSNIQSNNIINGVSMAESALVFQIMRFTVNHPPCTLRKKTNLRIAAKKHWFSWKKFTSGFPSNNKHT